jgi:hypothetical protein
MRATLWLHGRNCPRGRPNPIQYRRVIPLCVSLPLKSNWILRSGPRTRATENRLVATKANHRRGVKQFASASNTVKGCQTDLLNPAHALVDAYGTRKAMATAFVDWLIDAEGGQKTIRDFSVNGEVL